MEAHPNTVARRAIQRVTAKAGLQAGFNYGAQSIDRIRDAILSACGTGKEP